MAAQQFYPLVPCSPANALPLESCAAPTDGTDPGAKRWRLCLGASCPASHEWFDLRQQAGYWKTQFERCKEREQRLHEELIQLRVDLHAQAQQREQVLQQQIVALTAQVRVLEDRLHGQKYEKKRHPETGPTAYPSCKRRR